MPSLPLPQSLPKECRKAEKILKSFMETSRGGLDGVRPLPSDACRTHVLISDTNAPRLEHLSQVIPRDVLARAKGFCIFTVVKAGFLFSARAGSGIVIARLPDGSTSLRLYIVSYTSLMLIPRNLPMIRLVGPICHRNSWYGIRRTGWCRCVS